MACCLALGGLAAPAAAKTIVVTTLTDTADPPFNADGPCGTGTISDLPGTDHLISLREAIIAANNTNGADTITFDPSLSGGTIAVKFDDLDADGDPDPLPALCGGQTSITGDLNGDDVPDITLEGAAFPVASPPVAAAGILVLSSHNTIMGLRVQHFPIGIRVRAGDFTNPGTVEHTTVTNNIVAESKIDGIDVRTGNVPGSLVAHTTLTHNVVMQNARHGTLVLASLSAAGSDTQITYTTISDNEIMGNGALGILMFSLGDNNVITGATLAHNTISGNTFSGINVFGGSGGADENTLEVDIKDNTVTDNGRDGIDVLAGFNSSTHNHVEVNIQDNTITDNGSDGIDVVPSSDNSSNNHLVAQIRGNTLERHPISGIEAIAAVGAVFSPTGTSNDNVLEVRIERNTVEQTGTGMYISGGEGSPDGRDNAVADHNQTMAVVKDNMVGSTFRGLELYAGDAGLASANTTEVRVVHNTVCNNTDADIIGEGGYPGAPGFSPNLGTGNVLAGEIFQNTATTVTVADGTPGNTATVTQFNNILCP